MAKQETKKVVLEALVRRVIAESSDNGTPEDEELVTAYKGTEYADELLEDLRKKVFQQCSMSLEAPTSPG